MVPSTRAPRAIVPAVIVPTDAVVAALSAVDIWNVTDKLVALITGQRPLISAAESLTEICIPLAIFNGVNPFDVGFCVVVMVTVPLEAL